MNLGQLNRQNKTATKANWRVTHEVQQRFPLVRLQTNFGPRGT